MTLSGKRISSLGRAATIAAAIVGTSGLLRATGQPILTVINEIAFNLATAQTEVKKLREKAAKPVIASQPIPHSVELG
jgi:hypothetical protein